MKTPKDSFELLSKLLSEQQSPNTTEKTLLEDLFSFVTKDFATMLERNPYPQKAKLMGGMRRVLERAEILTQFPQLIGKTTIGILGTNGLDQKILDFVAKSKLHKINNNIPAVLYSSDSPNTIHAVNLIENQISLSEKDFFNANKELHKRDIDIRQFLYAFSISASIPYKAISYIHFPFYSLKSMEYHQNLLNMTDYIVIPTDERGIWKQTIESFARSNPWTPIVIVTDEKSREAVKEIVKPFTSKVKWLENPITIHQLDEDFENWLASINQWRNNVSFAESFLHLFSNLYLFQYKDVNRLAAIVEGMNRDLVKIDHEDTQFSLRKLKQELSVSLKDGRNLFQECKTTLKSLMGKVHHFEHKLYEVSGIPYEDWLAETFSYHLEYEEEATKLVLNFLECGEHAIVRKYMDKLESVDYPYLYILEMFKRLESNNKPQIKQLEHLAKESSSNRYLVVKAKIRFGEQLELPQGHIAQIAKQFPESLGSAEYYAVATDYEKCGDIESAKRYYLKALDEGALHAGNNLLRLLDSDRTYELEKLANMLIPEANYRFGLHCLDNDRYAKGITALKIAAVYEHIPAIRKLADIEFINLVKNKRSSRERAEKSMNIAMELYQYLLQKNSGDISVCENLGSIYYWKEDFRSARSLLEKGKSAEALFYCGKMYQYGNGVAKDLPKAKDYFGQAARKGHQRAKVEFEKVSGWISSNQQRETYNSGRNYSTSSSSSYSGSNGWCFLTTATCQSLGKEDDCEEILAFKKYRDEHLIEDSDGASLIREYYRIAPEIIEKIEQQPNSKETYQELYDHYIAVGYAFLLNKDYVKAKATYVDMVQYLCERYQIKVKLQNEKAKLEIHPL
ncbi:tetratricopeptide repeat protein [Paenibacillus sp. GCM10023250]|uniref:tetratricopeptide repeat protein n=1 Tax=Paenibacillus sp. GCM10023250 TaxID=3252648 RepID=UPI0036128F2D